MARSFLFSSAAAVLLLGLGLESSSSVEAAVLRSGTTPGSSGRRVVRKTTKAGRAHSHRNGQRDLQSGKGRGKGSNAADADSIFPSGMIATVDAIESMNQGIIKQQTNSRKSTKSSGSGGGGDTYSDNINYVDGESTPTNDPAITTPAIGTDDSSSSENQDISSTPSNPADVIGGPESYTFEIILPNSGTTDESFVDGSTITPPAGYQEHDQQEDEKERVSTDEFINLDDLDVDTEDGNDIVVIMPDTDTSGHTNDEDGLPDFEYGGNINNYSPNQGEEKEKEDNLNVDDAVDFIADDNMIDEASETRKKGEKDKDKPAKAGEDEFEEEANHEANTDPNADVDSVTTIAGQDSIAETILDGESQKIPSSPTGNDENEDKDEDGDIHRLNMPRGLVVSLFLSEKETRRLQGSPADPIKNQEKFDFVLNGMEETEVTLQNYLARHLNGYLVGGIDGLSFVSIDTISAFLTTKSYQGRPTPAIVVKSIEGTTTYRGIETPSPRILETSTLGAFNSDGGKTALIGNLRDSDDNVLSLTVDVSAEINRGAISPSSDATTPIVNAATQSDTQLRADSGNAAKMGGIAIGGVIIVVAFFFVGHKLTHRPKDETDFDSESSLEHKYDLDSIQNETGFSSTLVSYHGKNSSMEEDIASHHRNIMAYDNASSSYPEGTLVLSPVAESPVPEELFDDLVITKKIQVVAEEPQNEVTKIPSPLLRKIYSFSSLSLKRATLGNGLKSEMAAASMLGSASGDLAYDMSIVLPSASDDSNETPQEQSPCSDNGKSSLLLEDGLASKGPDPPATADLNESADTSRAIMLYSDSGNSEEEEDQTVPSTVDVDAVDSNEAAKRLGLGIQSFSSVKEEDEENGVVVKSSPKPVATPERRALPSKAKAPASVESEQQNVWRQQKSQAGIVNQMREENKLYDPIFVNGKVQMKERSPPYRQILRK